ncbi:4524_t:CDS:2 [Scutellospora calospora]|uniref:4524_t:CDS:1 n=1 Tax=Scutellospora calospora TaxID=85575 RepID=A0ACA9KKY0_9GLOM|nr:4524_t:CDS:2 [Scutellospora calospora]
MQIEITKIINKAEIETTEEEMQIADKEDDKKEAKISLPENTQRNEWKIYSMSKRNISKKEEDLYEQRKETNLRK